MRIRCRRHGHVAARDHGGVAARLDGGRRQRGIPPGDCHDIATGRHGTAGDRRGLVMEIALAATRDRVLRGAQRDRAEIEVSPGRQLRIVAGRNRRAGQGDVPPGQDRNVVGGRDAADRANSGGPSAVAVRTDGLQVGDRLRFVDHVSAGLHDHVLPGNAAADIAHVLNGLHQRGAAGTADRAAVDNVVAHHLRRHVADDAPAVGEIPRGVQVDRLAGHQCAGGIQVHRAGLRQIQLGHQHRLVRAVRQGHVLRYQPHHVAGELLHLCIRQSDPRRQVEDSGVSDAGIHQRAVLAELIGIARQERAARQLCDLVTHELLFIEAVAQALLRLLRVQAERAQHVVAGDELRVLREARVGGHQIGGTGCRLEVEQAVERQGQVGDARLCRA